MMKKETLLAQARGKAKAGNNRQKDDPLAARQLYLDAAELYIKASKLASATEAEDFKLNAKHLYNKAIAMAPRKRTIVRDEKQEEHDEAEVLDNMRVGIPTLRFKDIGGLDDVKQAIRMMIIEPFKYPELFKEYGRNPGGGILLYGPPGCGKTMLAEATAAEAKAGFYNVRASNLKSKFVGETEKNIALLFNDARHNEPSIIFLDEIEALGEERSSADSSHSRAMVSQLLQEMDGLGSRGQQILILGATNEPWMVDIALKRGGRFGKTLFIAPPDLDARKSIFRINLEGRPIDQIDYNRLAAITKGYSGADIKTICENATDLALQKTMKSMDSGKKHLINMDDLESEIKKKESSVNAWFALAMRRIKANKEEDSYPEIIRYYENIMDNNEDNVSTLPEDITSDITSEISDVPEKISKEGNVFFDR